MKHIRVIKERRWLFLGVVSFVSTTTSGSGKHPIPLLLVLYDCLLSLLQKNHVWDERHSLRDTVLFFSLSFIPTSPCGGLLSVVRRCVLKNMVVGIK